MTAGAEKRPATAFVLGGGGMLGATEVGMLRALVEAGVRPDLIVGASVGAVNGAFFAADPGPDAVHRLAEIWEQLTANDVYGGSIVGRVSTAVRSRTHLHPQTPLRRMLEAELPVSTIEELAVPFQCVAASIERAVEHWFTEGPLVEAVLASSAVPGLLPPVRIGDEHFLDGGLVHGIPIGRAVALGARTVYVLHVGRIERPLQPPRAPWEVALIAFEIARRHRFAADMAGLPPDVTVHVLPVGEGISPRPGVLRQQLRYRDTRRVGERMARAYEASAAYLAGALPR